jgi:hypothetical protein
LTLFFGGKGDEHTSLDGEKEQTTGSRTDKSSVVAFNVKLVLKQDHTGMDLSGTNNE